MTKITLFLLLLFMTNFLAPDPEAFVDAPLVQLESEEEGEDEESKELAA